MIGKFGLTSLLQDPDSIRKCGRDGTHLMNLGRPLPVLLLRLESRFGVRALGVLVFW